MITRCLFQRPATLLRFATETLGLNNSSHSRSAHTSLLQWSAPLQPPCGCLHWTSGSSLRSSLRWPLAPTIIGRCFPIFGRPLNQSGMGSYVHQSIVRVHRNLKEDLLCLMLSVFGVSSRCEKGGEGRRISRSPFFLHRCSTHRKSVLRQRGAPLPLCISGHLMPGTGFKSRYRQRFQPLQPHQRSPL